MIVILGPTATGKTRFAALLADKLNAEIISADSRQVYKKLDIGTGKDYADYIVGNHQINYYLIDIVDISHEYNVFEYKKDFISAYNNIISKGKDVIVCGGSGLYLQSILSNYRMDVVPFNEKLRSKLNSFSNEELIKILAKTKKLHNHTDTETKERLLRAIEIEEYYSSNPDNSSQIINADIIVGLTDNREFIKEKITTRLKERLKNNLLVSEVENLISEGVTVEKLSWFGLEYKYVSMYIMGELTYEQMFEKLNIAIHQFSKRQMTWFRKMERQGFKISWIKSSLNNEEKISKFFVVENNNHSIK